MPGDGVHDFFFSPWGWLSLAAIMAEGKQRYVRVAKGRDRVIERRNVTVAQGVGETLRVTEGLKVGETIVAAGGAYLSAGDTVRPWGS